MSLPPQRVVGDLQVLEGLRDHVIALAGLKEKVDALIADHREAVDLLKGMVGLVQIIQRDRPDLLANHRYVDAVAWLEEHGGLE